LKAHVALLALALSIPGAPRAEKAQDIPVVGILRASAPAHYDPVHEAMRDALNAVGYTEGRNIKLEPRFANGHPERLPKLVNELVQAKVSVIVAINRASLEAAMQATSTVPIVVVAYDHDPVAAGLIDNATRPGGNVTGIVSRQMELTGKRLELLKETMPALSRVAVIYDASRRETVSEVKNAGARLKLHLQFIAVNNAKELEGAFKRAARDAQAALLLYSPMLYEHRIRIGTLAAEMRLPVMTQQREFVLAGVLMAYAPDRSEVAARAAYLIDRLLKGARPADLPVEEAAKFKLTINQKTADTLGLKIPDSVLLRTDEVLR
jgi:putative ABC transport system substrate-binding protein